MGWREEWTAVAVADAVRSGTATAADAVDVALDRIEARDPTLSAFVQRRDDRARAEAAAVDARSDKGSLPLAGVPVAIKDNVAVEGEPLRNGSAATDAGPQRADHPVVARIRAAGGVVVGITAVPELCIFAATDSVSGVTRNPWDPELTPGGSSGGSAAAVAAGMVPIAHAADGMGSIRLPAACTGLVGIKPGHGVVPAQLGTNDWYGMAENGPLATTVADAALLLSVMADRPEWAAVREPSRRLRVALSSRNPLPGGYVDPAHAAAVEVVGSLLRLEGQEVRHAQPSYPPTAVLGALARWFAGAANDADGLDESRLEARTRTHIGVGRRIRTSPLMTPRFAARWKAKAGEFLSEHDVLVTPALAAPPFEAKRWGELSWRETWQSNSRVGPFAGAWNLAQFPAMSVPVMTHPEHGTPVNVQLVARPGSEAMLLSVAALIERVRPWPRVAPAYA
jgi:amidase